ncbi:MAG: hypothetical protein H6760_00290 [Candidatus Nomurabacteria bacterium]|nr:MAG: hypothetical protein H6760_00290 [Candidatus Nomurabacteria bacterium]
MADITGFLEKIAGAIIGAKDEKGADQKPATKKKGWLEDVAEIEMDRVLPAIARSIFRLTGGRGKEFIALLTSDPAKLVWARLTPDHWKYSNLIDNARNRLAVELSKLSTGEASLDDDEVGLSLAEIDWSVADFETLLEVSIARAEFELEYPEMIPAYDRFVANLLKGNGAKKKEGGKDTRGSKGKQSGGKDGGK